MTNAIKTQLATRSTPEDLVPDLLAELTNSAIEQFFALTTTYNSTELRL